MASHQTVTMPRSGGGLWARLGALALVALGIVATMLISDAMPGQLPVRRLRVAEGDLLLAPPGPVRVGGKSTVALDASGDYATVTFDVLGSYYYETPDPDGPKGPDGVPVIKDQIPEPIRALNGKRVATQGFMLPLTKDKGAVTLFMLLKDRSLCCFGRSPRMNEWVSVKMAEGQYAPYVNDQPVTVFGVMDVGEAFEKGTLKSIYRIAAEQVAGALGL